MKILIYENNNIYCSTLHKKSSFIDYKQFFDNSVLALDAIKISNSTLEVFDAKLIGYNN